MQLFLINTDDGRTPPMENAYTANAVESGEPLINTGEQQDGIMIVASEEENPTFVSATKARANREIRVTRVQENQLWEVLLDDGEELPKNFELHHSEARGTQTFYIGRFILGATVPEWLNIPDDIEDGAVPTYDATEEKVDWKVPQGGGGEDFVVNVEVSNTGTGGDFKIDECDKTAAEISAAYKAGKNVVANVKQDQPIFGGTDSYILPLALHSETPSQSLLLVGFFSVVSMFGGRFGIAAFEIEDGTPSFSLTQLPQSEE